MRNIVRNTEENLQEAEISAEFADPIQQIKLNQENNRRKQSIKSLMKKLKRKYHVKKINMILRKW